jgi:hypothetical protein
MDQCTPWKLDVNRASIAQLLVNSWLPDLYLRLNGTRQDNRQQWRMGVRQLTAFPRAAPLEELVRVHPCTRAISATLAPGSIASFTI